jgi:glycosyltransferase involved in cell wall biosynthesis
MRLLHLLRSLDPATGGPIEAVRLISLAHQADGHNIEIASLDAPGAPTGELPFPLHFLGPGRGVYGRSSKLVPWLRANHARFDAVIVNGLWQYHSYACRAALHGTGTPYFVFPHGMLDPWFKRRYPLKHLKKWLYWPWGDYRVLRDAAATLFTCEEEKMLASQSFWLYRANAVVTGLGTRAPDIDLDQAASQFFAEYPQLRGTRIVLFMGRLHPKKGCDLLLQAFAQTFADAPAWRLLIVGPDQLGWQPALEAMAAGLGLADRVCWAGPRMGESKWGALAAAEVFALPSHQENFGIAVAEALACGTPVLISDKVNIWREIQHERAGLVAPDTVEGTAQMLRQWASLDDAERQAFAQRAHACFAGHFDIRVCAEAVLAAARAHKRNPGIA